MISNHQVKSIQQQGRTLIELIIAMAIGLAIVIGVSSLYLSSSGASRTSNQVSTAEQKAQLAMLTFADSLKQAANGEIMGSDFAAQGQTLMEGPHLRGCTGSTFEDPFPPYVAPPNPQTAPDFACTEPAAGDSLYIRFQSRHTVAQMPQADADRNHIFDCSGSINDQAQVLDSPTVARAGIGTVRNIVTNVFYLDPVSKELNCETYAGGGAKALVNDVAEFKVFYRFDDAGYGIGANGASNASPFGGSIRDATQINNMIATSGPRDPWNYVVAVIVCMTIETQGTVSVTTTNTTASRCPIDPGEAETGLNLYVSPAPASGLIRRTLTQVFTIRARATPTPSLI